MKWVVCGIPPWVNVASITAPGGMVVSYKRLGVYDSRTDAERAQLAWELRGYHARVVPVKPFKFK
jgi:hypothetical protein